MPAISAAQTGGVAAPAMPAMAASSTSASPAVPSARRLTAAAARTSRPQTPVVRRRVPPQAANSGGSGGYDAPPAQPLSLPHTANVIQTRRSLALTMGTTPITLCLRFTMFIIADRIKNHMETIDVADYLPLFIEQEIDAAVFMRLTRTDVAKIVSDVAVADKIYEMIRRMNHTFGNSGGAG